MQRRIQTVSLFFLMFIFAVSLVFAPRAKAEAPILKELSGAEKTRVAKLIEGANKEGSLVFITNTMGPDVAQPLFEDFKKLYGLDNVKFRHTMKRSGAMISTVKKDIGAGRNTFDVINVGSAIFFGQLIKRKLLMKYDSPGYKNFIPQVTGEAPGVAGKKGYYVSAASLVFGIVWNPKYVKKEIKTWNDVLDPKYKGKIIMINPMRSATIVNVWGAYRKVIPRSFFEKLAAMDPLLIPSHRTHVRKVVAGEKWISVMTNVAHAYKAAKKGVKIRAVLPPGGTMALGYPMGILAKSPHPNAAKLWIDYLHSRRGHMNYLNLKGFSTGIKSPKVTPLLKEFTPPLEKAELIPMDYDKIDTKQIEAWRKDYHDIFYKQLKKK